MTEIQFYEKPGCLTNARQKQLLARRGHCVMVKNLLREPWTAERLRGFFSDLPVAAWFNPSAPRVRDGEIDPAALDADSALALLVADPLLIRRPLLDTPFGRCAGFQAGPVLAALGIHPEAGQALQACSRPPARPGEPAPACPPPERAPVPGPVEAVGS